MPNDGFPQNYRRIVLCFDGTGDWVENDVTNVAQMYACLDRTDQLCYYDGGVGTLGDSKTLGEGHALALKLIDLGTATSMGEKVVQAYVYLVRNHRPGVEIHMLGFSRGSYTARVLAGMIHNFGLLRPELEHLAPYLYQSVSAIDDIRRFKENARRMRHDFCRPERIFIQFMGVFDTVTSVGIVDRFRVFPNTDYNPAVLRTCHAVSIEEGRNAFPEALFHPEQRSLTEVWFPGVHRDCGGGVEPARARIADEALYWMETEARKAGMGLMKVHRPDPNVPPRPNYPSLDPYVILGFYPQKMFIKRVSGFRVFWPNFRHVRTIPEGALVHQSVEAAYPGAPGDCRPPNLPDRWTPFATGGVAFSRGPYVIRQIGINAEDAMGTILGSAMLLQLWNWAMGKPFGPSLPGEAWPLTRFPTPHGWLEAALFIAFLYAQAVGKGRFSPEVRSRVRPWLNRALPVAGFVVALGVAVPVLWTAFRDRAVPVGTVSAIAGLGLGVVAWAVAQLGPLPVVRADRALPYLLRNGFYAGLILGIVHWVVGRWAPGWSAPTIAYVGALILATLIALLQLFRDRPIMRQSDTAETPPRKADGPEACATAPSPSSAPQAWRREEGFVIGVSYPEATGAQAEALDALFRSAVRIFDAQVEGEASRQDDPLVFEYRIRLTPRAAIDSFENFAEAALQSLDRLERRREGKPDATEPLSVVEAFRDYEEVLRLFPKGLTMTLTYGETAKIELRRSSSGGWSIQA